MESSKKNEIIDNTKKYKVLYQKYRPNSFNDVIGQEQFVSMLLNVIKTKQVANAYIFSGPHGIGKTTLARIFAKALNCKDPSTYDACNKCESCLLINNNEALDIIEIDAASNNGVDNIRSIIDNSNYLPSSITYKVYIIDEAHMITTGGWNAFLKTLENPPLNVIYIFATTEIQKIPKTILSRCQIYNLFSLNIDQLMQLLNKVVSSEKLEIDEETKIFLCELANGSARDLLSILDQLISYDSKKITSETLINVFSLANYKQQFDLLYNLIIGKIDDTIKILYELNNKGINMYSLATNLLEFAVDWYVYKKQKNFKLIKPSHKQYFSNKDCNTELLETIISKLQIILPSLRKDSNQFLTLISLFITLNIKDKNESLYEKKEQKNLDLNNGILEISELDNKKVSSTNKKPPIESFIVNNKIGNEKSVHLDETIAREEFIKRAKRRIDQLDESWVSDKLPDISEVGSIQDITNEINENSSQKEFLEEGKKIPARLENDLPNDNKSLILTKQLDPLEYYVFATYNIDPQKNKLEVKEKSELFIQVEEDKSTKYVLLKDALELTDKLVLVNNHFMIILVSNKLKASKFNELINNYTLMNELKDLCQESYYIRAFTKGELIDLEKRKNTLEFNLTKYNNYINKLSELQDSIDIVSLTKKMLFKEE